MCDSQEDGLNAPFFIALALVAMVAVVLFWEDPKYTPIYHRKDHMNQWHYSWQLGKMVKHIRTESLQTRILRPWLFEMSVVLAILLGYIAGKRINDDICEDALPLFWTVLLLLFVVYWVYACNLWMVRDCTGFNGVSIPNGTLPRHYCDTDNAFGYYHFYALEYLNASSNAHP